MHFEILVEDPSGKKLLDLLVPRLLRKEDTFQIHAFRGIGHIPKGMTDPRNAADRTLLAHVPRLLLGYGKSWGDFEGVLILVCDLDDRCPREFRAALQEVLDACAPPPRTRFCFAVEEGEAWLLGDPEAIQQAYPGCKKAILKTYRQDSVCGTWELLADAVTPGGSRTLQKKGWQEVGGEKCRWAENVAPLMDPSRNRSPSFHRFLRMLKEGAEPS